MKKLLLLILASVFAYGSYSQTKVTVRGTLKGSLEDKRLYLRQAFNKENSIDPDKIIPVTDGKFEFEMEAGDTMLWHLLIYTHLERGLSNFARFYPDAPVVTVNIFPDRSQSDRYKHTVKGGRYNTSMMEYVAKRASYWQNRNLSDGDVVDGEKWLYEYLRIDPIPHGMFLIYDDLLTPSHITHPGDLVKAFDALQRRYPHHPYIRMSKDLLDTITFPDPGTD